MTAPGHVERREQAILATLPLNAAHVPDAETDHYDAVLVESFVPTSTIVVIGKLEVPAETPLELKTCQRWISDNGSRAGRRRGQFKINESTHEELVDLDGWYLFLVLEGDDLLLGVMIAAEDLEDLPFYNASKRFKSRRATLPWFKVAPEEAVSA